MKNKKLRKIVFLYIFFMLVFDGIVLINSDFIVSADEYGVDTYVYFTDNTTNVSSLQIANPSLGSGGTNWPYNATAKTARAIMHLGRAIVTAWDDGTVGFSSFDNGNPNFTSSANFDWFSSLAFDGLNIWVIGRYNSSSFYLAICLSPGMGEVTLAGLTTIENMAKDYFWVGIGHHDAPMIFDGRDIWIGGDKLAGDTYSGEIYRIPKASLR